jgi:SAM-dependent methyltransferase
MPRPEVMAVEKHDMRARWEAAHELPRFRPAYPHEQVVRWAFREFDRAAVPKAKVLDIGCGAGRHALFLAGEGFDTYACDISSVGLREVRAAAQRRGLTMSICQGPAQDLSQFQDASMDGALCFAVMYYLTLDQAEQMISEVFRVLRPGGKFLCVTRGDADSRRRDATPVGPCTWHINALGPGAPSAMEEDMDMLFFSKEDIERIFRLFRSLVIDRMTYTHSGFVDDDWVITAVKG